MLDRLPRFILGLEGAAVAAAAVALYFHSGFAWWALVVFALAPDLSAIGYVAGPAVGTAAYDTAHTDALPIVLGTLGVLFDADIAVQVALIWVTHIGVDRAVGYGLKYPTGFKDTHLQRV